MVFVASNESKIIDKTNLVRPQARAPLGPGLECLIIYSF